MSIAKFLGVNKIYCGLCGVRIFIDDRTSFTEFKEGLFCKQCADKRRENGNKTNT